MNERISELAKSCMIEKYNQHGNLIEDGFDYGKFAEMVVERCVSMMEWQKISPKDIGAYNSALSLAQRNIKEHFGVEE